MPAARTVKFETGDNQIYPEGFIPVNAYICRDELTLKQGLTRPLHDDGVQYTTLSVSWILERRCMFYFYNFSLPVFIINLLPMTSFFFSVDDLINRISTQADITVLVLLTTVAFRLSMDAFLPTSASLTMLDKYMPISLGLQLFVAVHNMITFLLATSELQRSPDLSTAFKFNLWSGTCQVAFWVLLHLCLPLIAHVCGKMQDSILLQDSSDFLSEKDLEKSPF